MRLTCTIAVLTALCGPGSPTVATLAGESTPPGTSANYSPHFQTAARPALLALPPGAVEPRGWLRDWALSVKDGYTACMDDVHKEFRLAWTPECTPTGENLAWQKGSWSLEGGAYWFDGLVELGFALKDHDLLEQARRRLHAVGDNMNDSGILFLWWLDRDDPETWKALYAANGGFPDTKDANTPHPAARWKFALDAQNPAAKVVRSARPARWDWPLAAPLEVTVNAIPIDWRPDLKSPTLPQGAFAKDQPSERITLIPYGCTKFRISMFPVTAEPEAVTRVTDPVNRNPVSSGGYRWPRRTGVAPRTLDYALEG
ncbi:MAG: hypothetical protein GXX96_18725 [Planctomycetaceae bacterium]|nr:hypothetical protein [Planctomycetaceae bacterium]